MNSDFDPAPTQTDGQSALLEARGLGKQVKGSGQNLSLLEDVNLTLFPGESLAITGPSGSGKSTLLGLLAGLDVPTQGEVLLHGQTFSGLNEDSRAQRRGKHCAFVFQDFHLVADLTALENVSLPLELRKLPDASERARQWLARVGLEKHGNDFPLTLSGGEQQRVALARAFAVQPRLLFADEPTGSLDQNNGQRISELLFELNQASDTALILVTHDADLAQRCQRKGILEAGRLRESSQITPTPSPCS